MKTGIELIAAERERQKSVEGWTPEHDDEHDDGQLAHAAAAYAIDSTGYIPAPGCLLQGMCPPKDLWPFESEWWKPGNDHPDGDIRSLVKAGALIAAEIDRQLRASMREAGHQLRKNGMRNLFEVVCQVLNEVPESEADVRAGLSGLADRCAYIAPEAQDWAGAAKELQDLFGPHEEKDWAKVALRIWRGEPPVMWVYEMDDVEWWAGPSLRACLAMFRANDPDDDECGAEARPLTEEEMDRLQYRDEDTETGERIVRSFREELARDVAEGIRFPCPFASTEG